jgi:hypothetical protein
MKSATTLAEDSLGEVVADAETAGIAMVAAMPRAVTIAPAVPSARVRGRDDRVRGRRSECLPEWGAKGGKIRIGRVIGL